MPNTVGTPAPGAGEPRKQRAPVRMQKTAHRLVAIVVGLALIAAACSDDDDDAARTPADKTGAARTAEFDESLDRFDRAFAAGQIEEFMAFFADDAQVLFHNAPPVIGSEAIRAAFTDLFTRADTSAYETQVDIKDVHGDRASVLQSFEELLCPRAGGTGVRVHGRIVTFWRAESDGTWRIMRVLTARSAPEEPEDC